DSLGQAAAAGPPRRGPPGGPAGLVSSYGLGLGGVVGPGGPDPDHHPAVVAGDLADHELDAQRQVLDRVVERVAVGRVGVAPGDPVTQVGAVQVGQRVPVLVDDPGRVAPLVLGGDHHRGVDVAEEQVLAAQLQPRVPAFGVGEAGDAGQGGVVVAVDRVRAGRVLDALAERG